MREWILTETEPRKIQEIFHLVSVHTHEAEFALGKQAIEILISEQQAKSSQTLESQTNALIDLTRGLHRLTLWIVILTAGLLIFTICLVIRG
jgi:hypothetical protein